MSEFQCAICKLKYNNKKTAQQCQDWCGTHASCNFLVAKQAINKNEVKTKTLDDERFNSDQ